MIHYKLLILLVLSALFGQLDAQEARMMRFPDFHENNVVFSYAGDIYLADRVDGTARKLTSHEGYEMFPRFSPDGSQIAFTGQYDGNTEVYVVPAEGGKPKRLTHTATLNRDDVSDRMGPNNIVTSWTPDGQYIVYRSRSVTFNSFIGHLFKVPINGGMSEQLPLATGGFNTFSEDGNQLAFNRVMREFRTWKYYKGGMADDIWLFDFKTKETKQLTDNVSQDIFPMWYKGDVYFASDRERTMNLYVYRAESKKIEKVTQFDTYDVKFPSLGTDGIIFENEGYLYIYRFEDKQLEKLSITIKNDQRFGRDAFVDASKNIDDATISPKGKRVLFGARGDVWSVPAKNGISYNLTQSANAHDREPAWSPDGKYMAWISDMDGEDQIYIRENTENAEPVKVTTNDTYIFSFEWSPDSKKIVWRDQDYKLNYVNIENKNVTEVVHSTYGHVYSYNWSPDSKWIVFGEPQENDMTIIKLYNLESTEKIAVTNNWYDAGSPIFSPCGKFIYFTSARDFSPSYSDVEWNYAYENMDRIYLIPLSKDTKVPFAPENDEVETITESDEKAEEKKDAPSVKVDAEGIADRITVLPIDPGYYWNLQPVKNKLFYSTIQSGDDKSKLKVYDFENKKETDVAEGTSIMVSADGEKVLVRQNGKYFVENVPGGELKPENSVDVSNMKMWVDKKEEWKQIYTEAWRQMREFFYAENMHGTDWKAMHDKYYDLIPYINHRNDLNYLIGELIGELNIGHAYINGGDRPDVERIKTGLLGAKIVADKSGYFQVKEILRGENWRKDARSPFTEPGVAVNTGDYIIAVDGNSTKSVNDFYQLLTGKANQLVELTVSEKANAKDVRKVLVKTIDDESELYYYNWVQSNIEKVNNASDRIGYIHIPDMGPGGLNEFVKHFYPQLNKEALIIDDRGNGGGNVSPMIMERLRRELVFYNMRRNRQVVDNSPSGMLNGPKVLLINGYSASDGDLFPYRFKMHKEGKIIGKRSWGGVVGITGSLPFIDGANLRKPEFAPFAKDGSKFIIEGHGVDPDIEIDNDPYKEFMGEDAQLNKAIEVILKELEQNPVKKPAIPPLPDKTK
ncbi:MAG: PDZ domain-containing protein [Salinivirgaceae bacterium]|jgi:tricorn protease|nr:PDZ domain-containing protein [Salinivirgaceae bacterium]